MSIRNKLLLYLLPIMFICTLFISIILTFNWKKEVVDDYKSKLKSAVITSSAIIDINSINNETFYIKKINDKKLKEIQELLEILDLNIIKLFPSKYNNINNYKFSFINYKKTIPSKHLKAIDIARKEYFIKNSKKAFFTTTYKNKSENIMSGYAPIFDANSNIIALISADVSIQSIDKRLNSGFLIIFISSFGMLIVMTTTIIVIANNISNPVKKLSNAALTIASGQYGNNISVNGPDEIKQLASTLNTMSECLDENINRLRETTSLKNNQYSERESSSILQNYMLKKVIEESKSDAVAISLISIISDERQGLLIDFPMVEEEKTLSVNLVKSKKKGFEEMYNLLTHYKLLKENTSKLDENYDNLRVNLDLNTNIFRYEINNFASPLFWSNTQSKLINSDNDQILLETGDFFFFISIDDDCQLDIDNIRFIITKVFRFFQEDGIDICTRMLKKELLHSLKKNILSDLHVIIFQKLY
jgi:HAMP domain-containing protein